MGIVVTNGAMCKCTFGTAPCTMVVMPESKVMASNMAVASIMSNQPVNLATFGMCQSIANPAVASATSAALGVLTPQPCAPLIPAPWVPGSPTVIVGGKPALNMSSKAMCMWAGVIEIVNPGQQTVNVP